MSDALISWLRQSLPEEVAGLTEPFIARLENGEYQQLLESDEARQLLGHVEVPGFDNCQPGSWNDLIFLRLGHLTKDRPQSRWIYGCIGYATLLAFIQSNVTGPTLPFSSAKVVLPQNIGQDAAKTRDVRDKLVAGMGADGIAAYKLTPNVELLSLAECVLSHPSVLKAVAPARWAKMRALFMRQRLLSEVSSTLQDQIYDDLDVLDGVVSGDEGLRGARVEFLLERASIHIHHGLDKLARADLEKARVLRGFEYRLTGLMGRRTKFQVKDTSQLVVLAKSAEGEGSGDVATDGSANVVNGSTTENTTAAGPTKLDLNDDTLLESISFTDVPKDSKQDDTSFPPMLQDLDPSTQPKLDALDSTILLSFASSVKNTSPEDGLTREETLPYATRVLEGGSSNWQVYTQALLVRSRVEGYNSRTVERGLLQLQALVDQVIGDTSSSESPETDSAEATTTFLPRPKESESAPVSERLRYIFQLASPTRWELEAELASRWVSLGGLRSALEIYERLEMWAEAALCWAATEREDKARKIVRRLLFHATDGGPGSPEDNVGEDETWEGAARQPPPLDAPRLYCILGDFDSSVAMYEKAWEVSNHRYARAQRSLGRMRMSNRDFVKAADAYSKSLRANPLNGSSWFALGCALLELEQYEKAAEAFSRCVQLDETDAEAWSNFAAALLRIEPKEDSSKDAGAVAADDEEEVDAEPARKPKFDPQKGRQDALTALKRAASLKHDSYRIWENVLIVAASLSPPDYQTALSAQKRIIDLRGKIDGEKCLDKQILELLATHVISTSDRYDPEQPGLPRIFVKFIDTSVIPLITGSADLWQLVSKLALWRNKPSSALEAEEKAWRAVTSQPGWDLGEDEKSWNAVVEATVRLCDSYESLGPKERTEGMGAGEMVARDWRFKARTAVRGILGKGKSYWEGTEGWERLVETLEGLKG
ncbi:TPR repeat-containing protein [Teratosphaeria destructans]|uniref:TPR repeat-containing protein n=1 Tax=Teratosphaeria destructans TaxID=418781 RepID=A0A9W7VXK4_9PEZI|nr:TPR repeat-containing protein [Teratosphaeria destructans]